MRLILINHITLAKVVEELEPDACVVGCYEDLTVGPVARFASLEEFEALRWPFLLDSPVFAESPLSEPMPMWLSGNVSFTAQVSAADRIEIWYNNSARDLVWWAFTLVMLSKLDARRDRVFTMSFGQGDRGIQKSRWQEKDFPAARKAIPVTTEEWQLANAIWDARIAMPDPPPRDLLATASPAMRTAFATLATRFPDATGISGLQRILISCGHSDWRKMARVVGDVMGACWDLGDDVGDLVLQEQLEKLAQMPDPAFEMRGTGRAMRLNEVRLTPRGIALKGQGR